MKFTDPMDARRSFPTLDTSATMKLEEYERVVGETSFPKIHHVECQLIRIDGRQCRTKFGLGGLVRRKDGVVVYIGGDCVTRHVAAGSADAQRLAAEMELLARKNRIDAVRKRIADKQSDPAYAAQLKADWARCIKLRRRIRAERSHLPELVLDRVADLRKRGRREVPGVAKEIEHYVDEEGKRRTRIKRHPITLGLISSPEGIDLTETVKLEAVFPAADFALGKVFPEDYPYEKELNETANLLEEAVGSNILLEEMEGSLEKFLRPENLRAVSWLALRDGDQERVVKRMLNIARKNANVSAVIGEWSDEIRKANGGRDFEPTS